MLKSAFPLLALVVIGCSAETASREAGEAQRGTHQPIVGGTTLTAAQDATVLLAMPNELCTGTLIAPNLVLTARHCVATSNDDSQEECVGYGPTTAPGNVSVFAGVNGNPDEHPENTPIAMGAKITVPQTMNMCSFDVAIVQLDRNVAGKIAPVRFTTLAPNEATTAVGYGVDGNDQSPSQRQQRTTTVLGVGPVAIPYTTKRGLNVTYNAPQGDVVTGESTCFGDSGGPLFDAQGSIVAITSRGIPQLFPEDKAQFGNGCIDQPSVFAGVRFHEQLIREAAKAAGHELPASTETKPASTGNGSRGDDDDDDNAKGDDDDSTTKKPAKKKRAATTIAAPPAACASAPGKAAGGSLAPILAAAVILAAARRRRPRG